MLALRAGEGGEKCPISGIGHLCIVLGHSSVRRKHKNAWHGVCLSFCIGGPPRKRLAKKEHMAEYEMSSELAGAVALVMEQTPPDWGAQQHLAALRYLVLACSDKASLSLEQLRTLKPGELKIVVDWSRLATEFHATGKLAECANFKKFLASGDYPELKKAAKDEQKYV